MKLDISKIENYENLTAEEKVAALESLELTQDYTGWVKKDLLDKASSEAANYKRQLRERMTEEEANKAKEQEEREAIQNELKQLREEKTLTEYKSNLLKIGYEDDLASTTAEAMLRGDMSTVFKNQALHVANVQKKAKAESIRELPTPESGNGSQVVKKDKSKMTLAEKQELAMTNPEEYKALYSND